MNVDKETENTAFTEDNKIHGILKNRSNRCNAKYLFLCSLHKITEFFEIAIRIDSTSFPQTLDESLDGLLIDEIII
jgi:hypothetical protein